MVTDDEFVPQNVNTAVNAAGVQWDWGAGTNNDHNVRQDDKLFRSGNTTDSGTYLVGNPSAGTFPYYCEAHGSPGSGMHGTLKIKPDQVATKTKLGEVQIGVQWAEGDLETGDRFDVQYRVGNKDWKGWKQHTAKVEGAFGKNGNPVEVKPGTTYKFRARSREGNKQSGFSPALKVTTPG